jgi:hypothetical protein
VVCVDVYCVYSVCVVCSYSNKITLAFERETEPSMVYTAMVETVS